MRTAIDKISAAVQDCGPDKALTAMALILTQLVMQMCRRPDGGVISQAEAQKLIAELIADAAEAVEKELTRTVDPGSKRQH